MRKDIFRVNANSKDSDKPVEIYSLIPNAINTHNILFSWRDKKNVWILLLSGAFVCVEVLRPSQPNGVMSSAVSLPNHMFTGQA